MNKSEIADFLCYLSGSEKDRQVIFTKYLKSYERVIKLNTHQFKWIISAKDMRSNAVLALHECFIELEAEYMHELGKISLFSKFCTKLKAEARKEERENLPLTKALKLTYKAHVGPKKAYIYEGYNEKSFDYVNTFIDELSDNKYEGESELEYRKHLSELIDFMIPDKNTNLYLNLVDRFVDGRTVKEIAMEPRNRGLSASTIGTHMKKYMEELRYKVKIDNLIDNNS